MEYDIDPIDYNESMSDMDAHLWQEALEIELESMYFNKVQELVEIPQGIKPIGRKRVYKRKRRVDGRVETYKVTIVVKGYRENFTILMCQCL